jgi:hypothetical protein
MSDTPETDAAILSSGGQWNYVLRECARRLERERDKARAECERLREDIRDLLYEPPLKIKLKTKP